MTMIMGLKDKEAMVILKILVIKINISTFEICKLSQNGPNIIVARSNIRSFFKFKSLVSLYY